HINGFMSEESAQSSQPLVLLTGLSSGIVLWMITPNGDAKEVYSTLQDGEGPAKLATLLKSPPPGQDEFSSSRPLLAVVRKGSGMQKHLHSTAVVISLRGGGREVKKFEFEKNSILDISSNKRLNLIATTENPGNRVYSAPEAGNPREHSPAMDVFSYGVLLIEMSICAIPQPGNRRQDVNSIRRAGFKGLVQRCVMDNCKLRPKMSDIINELTQSVS
uniref:BCAS3 WD40 domain-containing protein n=1 Tax=Amphimedon queenslandica TaxID=400682 RepID=A0A1X7VII3_AMPQE